MNPTGLLEDFIENQFKFQSQTTFEEAIRWQFRNDKSFKFELKEKHVEVLNYNPDIYNEETIRQKIDEIFTWGK